MDITTGTVDNLKVAIYDPERSPFTAWIATRNQQTGYVVLTDPSNTTIGMTFDQAIAVMTLLSEVTM